ncbi:ubiquitin-associated domain-containing protein 2 isoform X1 [Takifugu rubripes]|uniref:UBA domain containing 2 n=2 Tax=Takifugu TaxID=31032 RepID=H2TIA8_TAKRU|nr:ubiquitin-associated domain-containing protein 2 isoform X1 [Takifugu rubripes]XP_056904398.1 ubiquitin-associated domain-containing protein 2 isoform X1 [Takifugu flavidus]TWW78249.1 Ubiquitin-associated domain-containing protein 2 [Takifugu flavidus]|eukprot:XP_003963787.1 PREDICTED: ubiquitin-associated domain-containing protein 2 isoform X1 [Takifugu rubripes]
MFTSTGSRGLYKAPLSKGLLLLLNGLTVIFALLPQHQNVFTYNLQAVRQQHQVWRLLCGRLVCLDVKDAFCSSLLIYNFRVFERRFGTRKFASFLLGCWCLSALLDVLLVQVLHILFEYEVKELPPGLLAPVFSFFVPFYLLIPRMPVTQVLGQIHITNKSLVYVVGLQLLTSSPFMWLLALSGLISGALYHSNVLWLQKLLFVPMWMSHVGHCLLEPLFSCSKPSEEAPLGMGATLEIQRQQRMDLLDQQMLLAHYSEARRNPRNQPQPGFLHWTRLFPSLRHRGHNRPLAQPLPQGQTPASTQPPLLDNSVIAEEQVARLVEMGFSRIDALEALRASNNDINVATNFLLQH